VTLTIVLLSRPVDNGSRGRVSPIPFFGGSLVQDPTAEDGKTSDGKMPDSVPIAQYQSGDFDSRRQTLFLSGTVTNPVGTGSPIFQLDGTFSNDRIRATTITSYQSDCTIDVVRVAKPN
jgi:hypothetical protein